MKKVSDWKVERLGDVCETGAGGTPLKSHKDYYEGGTIPWLLSGEVSQGEIFEATNFITEKGLQNSSARLFPPNTVLIAMYGATAGQVGILRFASTTNQAVCGILPNEKFLPEFLYYCFLSKKDELVSQAIGGAQPNISQIKIKNTLVPIPPLPEQQRIVALLDETFAALTKVHANAERNLVNARELFDGVSGNLFSSKNKQPKMVALGELLNVSRGYNPPKSTFSKVQKNGYVRFYQIRDGWNDDYAVYVPDTPQLHKVNKDDILMVAYRHIGRVFRGVSGAFNVALCKIQNNRRDILDDDYLLHLIPTKYIKGELMKSSERSLIPSMSIDHLREIQIPLPPLAEQRAIVQRLDALAKETRRLEQVYQSKVEAVEELRKSILQKAFAGEL